MDAKRNGARVALYGGTFDPVHDAHVAVACELLKLFTLDEVLFIPAHVAPHKRRNVPPASPWHRYAMLTMATQSESRLRVSTVELDKPEKPYTVETIARLKDAMPGARFLFVMGADSWDEITTWREWERLLSMCAHVVVTRPGYEIFTEHVTQRERARIVDLRLTDAHAAQDGRQIEVTGESKIYFTDAVKMEVASRDIRRRVREAGDGQEVDLKVPPPVAEYIKKYRLYREAHETERHDAGRERAHD
ncbi:MAG TPA: nicotinate-nucleotide adenylyltransferase [Pyrinomonadaceae bacterium]|jgi:nicotinate-nucleotide adenylyltransferase|nr:nicotinate-nucleotide adenylyltransferase [Pyrinomonadaceae bacterium]